MYFGKKVNAQQQQNKILNIQIPARAGNRAGDLLHTSWMRFV